MSYDESDLSSKQRDILRREENILAAAESILIADGFLDMSMARIAQKSKCPRGTIYLHFASREDILVALACKAWEKRLALMERGAAYGGPPRLRVAAILEGFVLFYQLYPQQFSILHKVTETICEKASPYRLESLRKAERASADIVRVLVEEAIRVGDLRPETADVDEIVFGFASLATGGFALHQLGFFEATLRVPDAMDKLKRSLNVLADAYQWQPMSETIGWDALEIDIRRKVFPEEARLVYGPGPWEISGDQSAHIVHTPAHSRG